MLVDTYIGYKFEDGWAVGKICQPLDDPTKMETVLEGDLSGERPLNFCVYYHVDDEVVDHLLTIDNLAGVRDSVDSEVGTWTLLTDGSQKRQRVAATPASGKQLMTREQAKKLTKEEREDARRSHDGDPAQAQPGACQGRPCLGLCHSCALSLFVF